jgi:hypothetical protein
MEGLENAASAVGNPGAFPTVMVLIGALPGSSVAAGRFKVTVGPDGFVIGKGG